MKGLIVQQPHLNNILNGLKTVMIRTRNTKFRDHVALCYKDRIYGFAKIVDSYQVLRTQLLTPEWEKKHRAIQFLVGGPYSSTKVLWVWELSCVEKLKFPIPYAHPKGAVIWVNF